MTEPLPLDDWPALEAGRGPAGRALLDWAADPDAERLCLVTGSAGAGKSALLAWFTEARTVHGNATVHALVPCEGLGFGPAVWILRHQLHYGGGSAAGLLRRAAADRRPMLIVLADLHLLDSGGPRPGSLLVPEVIEPLLELPWVRVLAETRDPRGAGFPTPARVLDLDDPALTDRAGYAAWYARIAGAAPVVPADTVFPHPALGQVAAVLPADPSPEGELCAAWWAAQEPAVRQALRTLALARGPMEAATWRLLHAGLRPQDPDAAAAVDRAAAQLAVQQAEFRLPLPRMATLARHDDGSGEWFPDPEKAFDVLLGLVPAGPGGRPDWERAPAYVRDHLLAHAPGTRTAATLLSDPGFLVHTAPEAVTRALDDRATVTPPSLRATWYPVAPVLQGAALTAGQRAAALHACALATAPRLAELLAPAARAGGITARWTLPRRTLPVLDGPSPTAHWPGALEALAPGADGTVLAADALGHVRTLSTADGTATGRTVELPLTGVADLARLAGGALVIRDHDGVLRISGEHRTGLAQALAAPGPRATCLGATGDGGTLVVGDTEGGLRLFGADGTPAGRVTLAAGVPVTAASCLRDDKGGVVVVAGLADGSVTLWAPPKPPLEGALTYRGTVPVSLAAARTRVGPVIAVAWADQVVTVDRLGSGPTLAAHPYHDVLALSLAPDGVLVGAGYDGITCWECDPDALA